MNQSQFRNNSAPRGSGGAIYIVFDSALEVSDSRLNGNSAGVIGGALGLQINSFAKLVNVTLDQNDGLGTVNSQTDTILIVTNCSFTNNINAIFSLANGTLDVSYSTFTKNVGLNQIAGAITAQMSNVTLLNITFVGNTAKFAGAAVYVQWFVNITMVNCVFLSNTAHLDGAALFAYQYTYIVIENSLIVTKHSCQGSRGSNRYNGLPYCW